MKMRYITEADVTATYDVKTSLDVLDAAARAWAAGEAMSMPRQRPRVGKTTMQVLPAAYADRIGHKTYITGLTKISGVRFFVTLFDAETGALLAMIESDMLGQIRTGAACGLATRAMARPESRFGVVIGSGRQAGTQLEAMCLARPLERVKVVGRDAARGAAFIAKMQPKVKARLEFTTDGAAAVRDADVVTTITTAAEPVLLGAWLKAGTHVNAAGSNHANRREIDAELVRRSSIIAVEDAAQAKVESGDLLFAEREGTFEWPRAVRFADIIAGTIPGRTSPEQITLFESLGVGLWDVASAKHIYARCLETGRGRDVELTPDLSS
jgi:alanine dehydrogenase